MESFPLFGGEIDVTLARRLSLPAVREDRFAHRVGPAIVQERRVAAQAPQGCVRSCFPSLAPSDIGQVRTHVVDQEVGVGWASRALYGRGTAAPARAENLSPLLTEGVMGPGAGRRCPGRRSALSSAKRISGSDTPSVGMWSWAPAPERSDAGAKSQSRGRSPRALAEPSPTRRGVARDVPLFRAPGEGPMLPGTCSRSARWRCPRRGSC